MLSVLSPSPCLPRSSPLLSKEQAMGAIALLLLPLPCTSRCSFMAAEKHRCYHMGRAKLQQCAVVRVAASKMASAPAQKGSGTVPTEHPISNFYKIMAEE